MFVLQSRITIGGMTFKGVHEVNIKRSIFDLAATATIKVPVTAVLRRNGVPPTRVETAQVINAGDPVAIALGYNGTLYTEFVGYVKIKNLKTPLEIECEDAFYQTRQRSVTNTDRPITLSDLLVKTGVPVAYAAPLTLRDFYVDNKPASWVLGKLKTDYGLSIWFDRQGRLYASEPYKVRGGMVKYRLRYNTIDEDDLKFHRADDVKVTIKAVCFMRDGKKVEATIGTGGGEKTLYFYDVESGDELAALAKAELDRHTYDGYSGKITTFLQPFAEPGMIASLIDDVYSERDGNYYIESTEVDFGTSGARRIVELGLKV
jgi:hypothetical protein